VNQFTVFVQLWVAFVEHALALLSHRKFEASVI